MSDLTRRMTSGSIRAGKELVGAGAAGGARFGRWLCDPQGVGTPYGIGPSPRITGVFEAPDNGAPDWPSIAGVVTTLPLEAPPSFIVLVGPPLIYLYNLSLTSTTDFALRASLWAANGDGTQVLLVAGRAQWVLAGNSDFTYDWTSASVDHLIGSGMSATDGVVSVPAGGGSFGTATSMFSTYVEFRCFASA